MNTIPKSMGKCIQSIKQGKNLWNLCIYNKNKKNRKKSIHFITTLKAL